MLLERPEGDRFHAAVLLADLSGFTSLAERMALEGSAGTAGGAGLGQALVRYAEDAARATGGRQVVLDTPENRPWLPAFYEKLGYRRFGHIQWEGKTYRSVPSSRSLEAPARAEDQGSRPPGASVG